MPSSSQLDEGGKPRAQRLGRLGRRPIRGQAFLCPDSTWVTLRRKTAGSFLGPQCSIYKLQLVANKICASTTNCQLKRLKVQSWGGQDAFLGARDFAGNLPSPAVVLRDPSLWGENYIPASDACKAE